MTVPEEWVAVVVGALAAAILCLWRDNLKLRALILKMAEEKVALCHEILAQVQARRTDDES